MRGIYSRIGILAFLVLSVASMQILISNSNAALNFYIRNIFIPFQRFRSNILNHLSLSVGDFLYILLFLFFLLLLIRFIYYAVTFRKNKSDFWVELLRFLTFPLLIYFGFLLSWGGNYSRKPLSEKWETGDGRLSLESLIELNTFLIGKLNATVNDSVLIFPDLKTLNLKSNHYYHKKFGADMPELKVKPTTLGYLLSYLGIHGYYNPLSGEAQLNKFILPFMHPFVVTHEMAHQIGVAKEDDANLLAYIIGVQSQDPAYQYSSYFNLLLYAYADLKKRNTDKAEEVIQLLNLQSQKDMEDLKEMYRKYKSRLRGFSNSLYNEYLRLHGQQKGIKSYNQVTKWVYYWEVVKDRQVDISLYDN